MKDHHFDIEEDFHSRDRKAGRKERKHAQKSDRSSQKKTDIEKGLHAPKSEVVEADDRIGRVLKMTSGIVTVAVGQEIVHCGLRGSLKLAKTDQKNLITVGDFVVLDREGQIKFVKERKSFLARKDNLRRRKQQLIAANIDQVLITTSVQDPYIKPSLIDRYIIATLKGNMKPVIVVNKVDLFSKDPLLKELEGIYAKLGIPLVKVSAIKKTGLDELFKIMKGKSSVFSGQSGVGKTSLINEITGSDYRVGDVVEKTGKGAHTTTSAELIKLDDDTFCVDTPGIKSFSLWDITSSDLLSYFQDLQGYAVDCKFMNCTHMHEPGCRVKEALESGDVSKLRYDSYITIRENNDEDQRNPWD